MVNLSTEELNETATKKMMIDLKANSKNKVMRLSIKEEKLINSLRDSDMDLLRELRSAFNDSQNKENLLNLKKIISILEDRTPFDIDSLVDMDFISKEKAEYLIKCLKENKNIVITGEVGVGKTTLLNAIINYQENVALMLFEKNENEIIIDNKNKKKTVVRCKDNDIFNILNSHEGDQDCRLALSEIGTSNDKLLMIYSLNMGISIIGTSWCEANWREFFINSFDGKTKIHVEETLNKNRFIQINISMIDGKRKVTKIEEV